MNADTPRSCTQKLRPIGCRFDLPLFHYRDWLDSAEVALEDGTWERQILSGGNVTIPGGGAGLGCGTMFAFTSWSYVHDVFPIKEVLYIDAAQRTGSRDANKLLATRRSSTSISPTMSKSSRDSGPLYRSASNQRTFSPATIGFSSLPASTGCSRKSSRGSSPRRRAAA